MNSTHKKKKVAISCMTFNQASYIRQCLNGFVIQKTDFPFVAIVVDDASTDSEQKILWDFINQELGTTSLHKDETEDFVRVVAQHKTNKNCTFVIILLKYNHFSTKKDKLTYIKEWQDEADYIAFCEGDDYWIDPLKLQKQVDILDNNPKIGLVYTNHKQYIQERNTFVKGWSKESCFEDMLLNNLVCTLTTCFRKNLWEKYIYEFNDIKKQRNWKMGDYPLWLYFFACSKTKYLDDVTGVYRVLKTSLSHFDNYEKRKQFIISTYDICKFFAYYYKRQDMIKRIAIKEIRTIINDAIKYNSSINFDIISHFCKYKLFYPRLFMRCLIASNKYLRCYFIKLKILHYPI